MGASGAVDVADDAQSTAKMALRVGSMHRWERVTEVGRYSLRKTSTRQELQTSIAYTQTKPTLPTPKRPSGVRMDAVERTAADGLIAAAAAAAAVTFMSSSFFGLYTRRITSSVDDVGVARKRKKEEVQDHV
ncbi:hypothetical protein BKA80DRAFT_255615 [Phyllosticta citrichinensis]